jgi:predicted nucleic acid-binding protein
MSASVDFLDANVILYGVDVGAPEAKRRASRRMIAQALEEGTAVISWQVVQETLHVMAHKFKASVTDADRSALLRDVLAPLWRINPATATYQTALDVQARYRFAFYDSLIVASALEAGCKRLLTEDLQHGQRIGNLRIENPFRS